MSADTLDTGIAQKQERMSTVQMKGSGEKTAEGDDLLVEEGDKTLMGNGEVMGPLERLGIVEEDLTDLHKDLRVALKDFNAGQKRKGACKIKDEAGIDSICERVESVIGRSIEEMNRGIKDLDDVDVGKEAWSEMRRERGLRKILQGQIEFVCDKAQVENLEQVVSILEGYDDAQSKLSNKIDEIKDDLEKSEQSLKEKDERIHELESEVQKLKDDAEKMESTARIKAEQLRDDELKGERGRLERMRRNMGSRDTVTDYSRPSERREEVVSRVDERRSERDREEKTMQGLRWNQLNLGPLTRYAGRVEKDGIEGWRDFKDGFWLRYGNARVDEAYVLLREFTENRAKDVVRMNKDLLESAKSVKEMLELLGDKVSEKSAYAHLELAKRLRKLSHSGKTIYEYCTELEEITRKLYKPEDAEQERCMKIMLEFEQTKYHRSLLELHDEGELSYERLKRLR